MHPIKKDNVKPCIHTRECVHVCAGYGGYTGNTSVTIRATAWDNLDRNITSKISGLTNGVGLKSFPFGKSKITLSVTDSSGNVATQDVSVTIEDCQNPWVKSTPGLIIVDSDKYGQGPKVAYKACTGKDDVTPPAKLKWSYSKGNNTVFKVGSTDVRCTATDESGRKSKYGTFTVYVRSKYEMCKGFQADVEKAKCGLSAYVANLCQKVHDRKEKEECDCYKDVGQKLNTYKMSPEDRVWLKRRHSEQIKPSCGLSSSRKML
jgi:hypothetical protein